MFAKILISPIFATMETIPKSECRQIGTIRKTHGVHGRLILEFNPQFEDTIEQTKHLFLEIDGLDVYKRQTV